MIPKTVVPPEVQKDKPEQSPPPFNVVLLDDQQHTYEYVIEMLQKLFLLSEVEAFQRAVEVDTEGRTIVITCGQPEAEFGRDQILSYGPDWRHPDSSGPMKAIVEPAGGGRPLKG